MKESNKRLLKCKNLKFWTLALSMLLSILSENIVIKAQNPVNYREIKNENVFTDNFSSTLSIVISDDEYSYDWIDKYPYIENLRIHILTNDENKLKGLENLSKMKKLTSLSLKSKYNLSISNEKYYFLKKCYSLRKLDIEGFSIEKGFLESFSNLDILSLEVFGRNFNNVNTDYSKLTFLKTLNFKNSSPYNISIWFTLDDYRVLLDNNVRVCSSIDGCLKKVVKINKKLNAIVKSLDIKDSDSEKERFNKVLIYVLDNLEYDEEVNDANINNDPNLMAIASRFYTDGFLYGALEKDSAICGNYTALFTALAERVGLDSYCLCNSSHAWNLVQIDGKNYYTDSTMLDDTQLTILEKGLFSSDIKYISAQEAIENNLADRLTWYLLNPSVYLDGKKNSISHQMEYLPSYIEITPLENNDIPENFLSKNFELSIFDKKIIVSLSGLVSILISLKIICKKSNKKHLKKMDKKYLDKDNQATFQNN